MSRQMLLYEIDSHSAFVIAGFSECCFHTGLEQFLIEMFALKALPIDFFL